MSRLRHFSRLVHLLWTLFSPSPVNLPNGSSIDKVELLRQMQTTGYERSFGGGSRRQRINIGAAKNKAANSGEVPSLDMRGVYAFAVQKGKAWVPQIGRVNAVMRRSGMMGKGKRVRVTYPIPLDDVNALERVSVRVEWFEERAGVFVAAYAVDQGDHPAHTVLGVVATKPCKGDGQFTVNSNDWERAVKKCRADHAAAVAVRSAAAARQPALLARQSQRESLALPGGPQMKRVTSKVGGRTRLVVDASQLWSRVRNDPSKRWMSSTHATIVQTHRTGGYFVKSSLVIAAMQSSLSSTDVVVGSRASTAAMMMTRTVMTSAWRALTSSRCRGRLGTCCCCLYLYCAHHQCCSHPPFPLTNSIPRRK